MAWQKLLKRDSVLACQTWVLFNNHVHVLSVIQKVTSVPLAPCPLKQLSPYSEYYSEGDQYFVFRNTGIMSLFNAPSFRTCNFFCPSSLAQLCIWLALLCLQGFYSGVPLLLIGRCYSAGLLGHLITKISLLYFLPNTHYYLNDCVHFYV